MHTSCAPLERVFDPERDVVPLNTLRKPEETFVEKQKRV
jgi:hypothetical protein